MSVSRFLTLLREQLEKHGSQLMTSTTLTRQQSKPPPQDHQR